jgi:nucleotide-binding universal stress UspA family protein
MDVLVPVDGSELGWKALRFGVDLANRYDGSVHVIHVTDHPAERESDIVEKAEQIVAEAGLEDEPDVIINVTQFRWANRVGKEILTLVQEEEYDHIVMGHHGTGAIGRAILGSTAETVVRGTETPVTVIP